MGRAGLVLILAALALGCGTEVEELAVRVTWLDPARTHDGFTLLVPPGGKDLYWVAMDGTVAKSLHLDWTLGYAEQQPSGNLLTLSNGPIREIDGAGRTVWRFRSSMGFAHHDVIRSPRDTVFTLTLRLDRKLNLWVETIIEVDRRGNTVWSWNALDHLDPSSSPEVATQHQIRGMKDWLHMNSLDLFPDGDVLLSIRNQNRLVRIDYPSGEIIWSWGDGVLGHQHSAKLLENGHITIFDNGIYRTAGSACAGKPCVSRALEIDPNSGEIVWSYEDPELFSLGLGDVDRLPNGNTLITFGWNRPAAVVLEVSPEGEVLWRLESLLKTVAALLGDMPQALLYRAQRVEYLP